MCIEEVEEDPNMLRHVPDHFNANEMYNKAVGKNPQGLQDVPDHFKAKRCAKKPLKKCHG